MRICWLNSLIRTLSIVSVLALAPGGVRGQGLLDAILAPSPAGEPSSASTIPRAASAPLSRKPSRKKAASAPLEKIPLPPPRPWGNGDALPDVAANAKQKPAEKTAQPQPKPLQRQESQLAERLGGGELDSFSVPEDANASIDPRSEYALLIVRADTARLSGAVRIAVRRGSADSEKIARTPLKIAAASVTAVLVDPDAEVTSLANGAVDGVLVGTGPAVANAALKNASTNAFKAIQVPLPGPSGVGGHD